MAHEDARTGTTDKIRVGRALWKLKVGDRSVKDAGQEPRLAWR